MDTIFIKSENSKTSEYHVLLLKLADKLDLRGDQKSVALSNLSNLSMQDLLKIVKSLKDSGILLNGITETVKNEVKEQKGGFLSMLLGTLGASLLGDLLTKNLSGRGVIRAGEGTIRAGHGSKKF